MDALHEKYEKLKEELRSRRRVAVAFSAGVDSSLLLYAAREALGDGVLAVTGRFLSFPDGELEQSREICRTLGAEQIVVDFDQMAVEGFCDNPPERCYICKKAIFSAFLTAARERGFSCVADGANADDAGVYRPGMRATAELGIISPLRGAGLTKDEIRLLAREAGLPVWDKPSAPCLATRFPYGERITEEKIRTVAEAEKLLSDLGFRRVRVRSHGDTARIEIDRELFCGMLDPAALDAVTSRLHALGFTYVALDLDGYESGSMDRKLRK